MKKVVCMVCEEAEFVTSRLLKNMVLKPATSFKSNEIHWTQQVPRRKPVIFARILCSSQSSRKRGNACLAPL